MRDFVVIFLRHPEPDVTPGTIYGRLDMGITAKGKDQIKTALGKTPPLTRVFASPALRCKKLAEALGRRDGITPIFSDALWELDMGEWEGRLWDDIPRKSSNAWFADPVAISTPGGESFGDLIKRVSNFAEAKLDDQARTTAFVCHAGPIRAMQMHWLGLSFNQAFANTPGFARPIIIEPPETKAN